MDKTTTAETNREIAKRYLATIEQGATPEALANIFHPDVVQEEFPNRLTPNGARRNIADLLEASRRGKKVMSRQSYEVVNSVSEGDGVSLEVLWTGVLAVPYGSIPVGGKMRAHFAVFLDFRDGKIIGQRNYDCFDPW
jgi:ketosteroid isomerase-like protein